jgi:hypothetical protein
MLWVNIQPPSSWSNSKPNKRPAEAANKQSKTGRENTRLYRIGVVLKTSPSVPDDTLRTHAPTAAKSRVTKVDPEECRQ